MRTVKEILDGKGKTENIIDPGAKVIDALHMLNEVNLSYLIVMEHDAFCGVFSERDYTRNVVLKGRSSPTSTVKEVMSTDLPRVSVMDTAEDCMHIMSSHRTRYVLAYEGQKFCGVITIHDLLRQVISSKEGVFNHTLAEQLLDTDEQGKIF